MNITVLYGPGEIGKRSELIKIKKGFSKDSTKVIDLKQEPIGALNLALSSVSLFDQGNRLVAVENVPDSFDCSLLQNNDSSLTLVLVAGNSKASSVLISSAKKSDAKMLSFEGEQETSVFPFLDCLLEGKRQSFVELEKLLSEYGGMYVLSMVYYALRRNLLPLPASDYMRKKITNQSQRFSISDWTILYESVLQTEYDIKTGKVSERLGLYGLVMQFLDEKDKAKTKD